MEIFRPGDDKYEELLKGILARLDERSRQRRETPEFLRLQAELNKLEAEGQNKKNTKIDDDQTFLERQRKQKCDAIKTQIEHLMDDWHQAERPYRVHRRQFEEALEKHRTLRLQSSKGDKTCQLQ
jgi:hypothetical protein